MAVKATEATSAVACRVTTSDAEAIRRVAYRRGVTVSALLRDMLDGPLAELRRALKT